MVNTEWEGPKSITEDNCPFYARIFDQELEYGSGYIRPGFFIYGRGEKIPIPEDVKQALLKAETPRQMETIIADAEPRMATLAGREYLDCDEAANLMTAALNARGIPHRAVVGTNNEGYSHAYVIVDNIRYDPTKQGYGDGRYWTYTEYTPKKKPKTVFVKERKRAQQGRGWWKERERHSEAARRGRR